MTTQPRKEKQMQNEKKMQDEQEKIYVSLNLQTQFKNRTPASINQIYKNLHSKKTYHLYEFYDTAKLPVRVHIDYDDFKYERQDGYADEIKLSLLYDLNNIFQTTDDDWAISSNHREYIKKDKKGYKYSFHMASTKYKMYAPQMGKLFKGRFKHEIDDSIYSSGPRKWRIPLTTKDDKSTVKSIAMTHTSKKDFKCHIIQNTDGCTFYNKKPSCIKSQDHHSFTGQYSFKNTKKIDPSEDKFDQLHKLSEQHKKDEFDNVFEPLLNAHKKEFDWHSSSEEEQKYHKKEFDWHSSSEEEQKYTKTHDSRIQLNGRSLEDLFREIVDEHFTKISKIKTTDAYTSVNIKKFKCGHEHRHNHNYIILNKQSMTIEVKCHSAKCANFSLMLYTFHGAKTSYVDHNNQLQQYTKKEIKNLYQEVTFDLFKLFQIKLSEDEKTKLSEDELMSMNKKDRINAISETKKENIKKLTEKRIRYFNQFHTFITNQRVVILHSKKHTIDSTECYNIETITKDIKGTYPVLENKKLRFISAWLANVNHASKQRQEFCPPKCPKKKPNDFNLFTGLLINKLTGPLTRINIDFVYDHIKTLVNFDEQLYDYLINYLAHLMQFPGVNPQVALLFISIKPGVGKNLFFENFVGQRILGQEYVKSTSQINDVLGRFNDSYNKLFICIDEVNCSSTYEWMDTLKNRITGTTIKMERKGIDQSVVNHFCRYLFFSNADRPLILRSNQRRFCCFDCSNEYAGNTDHFVFLANRLLFDDDVAYSFYMDLLEVDLTNVRINVFPKTSCESRMTMAPETQFLFDYYPRVFEHRSEDDESKVKISSTLMYDWYSDWIKETGREHKMTRRMFTCRIRRKDYIKIYRTSKERGHLIDLRGFDKEIQKIENDLDNTM